MSNRDLHVKPHVRNLSLQKFAVRNNNLVPDPGLRKNPGVNKSILCPFSDLLEATEMLKLISNEVIFSAVQEQCAQIFMRKEHIPAGVLSY